MANIQYQRSAQPGSYRPQQVDDRNIARLREEAARQIQGLQAQAKVEIENRERVSQAMKENADITARQEERNFQIQTQNTQNTINGLAAQARRDQEQAAINQKATASIFESISSFSTTASKIAGEINKQKEDEKYTEDSLKETDADEKLRDRLSELSLRAYDLNYLTGLTEAELTGANQAQIAELRGQSTALGFDITAGEIYQYVKFHHADGRNAHLKAVEKRLERPLTYEEKKEQLGVYTGQLLQLMKDAGVSSRYARRLVEGITASDTAFLSKAQAEKKKATDDVTVDSALTAVQQADPTRIGEVFTTSFKLVSDIKGGPVNALDLFQQKVFNVQDPKTGEFLISEESILNLPLVKNGKNTTFGQSYSDKQGRPVGRLAEILAERVKLQNEFRNRQATTDRLSHMEFEDQALQFLSQEGNGTAKNVRELQRMYSSMAYHESDKLKFFEKHLTYEAKHREKVIQQASQLRDFELTPEVVKGVCQIDPVGCKPIKDRADQFNAKWKSAGYTDSKKALEKLVSGTTTIGTIKSGSNEELRMIAYLHAELEKRTAQYEKTLGFEGARLQAGKELEDLYTANYRNNVEGNIFYRKSKRTGVSYPYLPKGGDVSAAQQVRDDVTELRATSVVNGLDRAIADYFADNPERLEYIKNNYDKPTFQPTPQELALVSFGNGIPLHTVYNKGFASANDSTVLESPLKANGQEIVLTPAQHKIISNPLAGPDAKMSVIRSVLNPSSFQDPGTMRPGPIANAVRVQTAVSGQGFTAKGLNDAYGRPIVFGSTEALSGFQRLIQLSGGRVKASDITSSQRSHVHNEKVGGSATSYHREGAGLAFDITAGPALEWMKANPELVKQAGFSTEPNYTSAHGHYVFGL